jgi:transcriptional regulator with XRE-family HTH domain
VTKRSQIGSKIHEARLRQGFTQDELAQKINSNQPTISNLEKGKVEPNQQQLQDIERALGPLTPEIDASSAQGSSPFGEWLRRERERAELSVAELAERSGLTGPAIYNLESGVSLNPQRNTKKKLEKALGKSVPTEVSELAQRDVEIESLGSLEDFDPHSKDVPTVPGVYVFYDISQRPVYVGKARDIANRVAGHQDAFWFKRPIVENASFIKVENATLRHQLEQVLIKFLKSNAVINKQSVDRE